MMSNPAHTNSYIISVKLFIQVQSYVRGRRATENNVHIPWLEAWLSEGLLPYEAACFLHAWALSKVQLVATKGRAFCVVALQNSFSIELTPLLAFSLFWLWIYLITLHFIDFIVFIMFLAALSLLL